LAGQRWLIIRPPIPTGIRRGKRFVNGSRLLRQIGPTIITRLRTHPLAGALQEPAYIQ